VTGTEDTTTPGATGTTQTPGATGMAQTPGATGMASDQRSQLEAAAQRDGYTVNFEDSGRIVALKSGAQPSPGQQTGQQMNDDQIESDIKAKLMQGQGQATGNQNIQVDAQGGVVTLRGQFPSADAQSQAIKLCLDHPGVQQVIIESTF
jgi:osmotically-inducible protein OsmY